MTPEELADSRQYIKGYYDGSHHDIDADPSCGNIHFVLSGLNAPYIIGWNDGFQDCVINQLPCYLYPDAKWHAQKDIPGLLLGAIRHTHNGREISIYFDVFSGNDEIPEVKWFWDSKRYPSSKNPRGWTHIS